MTVKSTGETCSYCGEPQPKGRVLLEGDGGALYCSVDCMVRDEDGEDDSEEVMP